MSPIVKFEIARLIVNWGYWKSGGGGIGGMIYIGVAHGDGWDEPRMPLLFGEARHTDEAMTKLLEPQQMVLKAHYLTSLRRAGIDRESECARDAQDLGAQRLGDQARAKAQELGISRRTFYRLLENSQRGFWSAFQLVRCPSDSHQQKTLDSVARIRIIPATVG